MKKKLRRFVEANSKTAEGRNMLQRLFDAIRRFIASLKKTKVSIDAEAARKLELDGVIDRLEQAEMLLREALKEGGQQRSGVSGDGGKAMMSLKVKEVNGTTKIVSPYLITKDEVLNWLRMSKRGKLLEHTYFPVRPDTPKTIIDSLQNAGIAISDEPLAMQAKKAKQSQVEGEPHRINRTIIRHHALKAEEMVEALEKIDQPHTIIQQTNRTKKIKRNDQIIVVDAPDNFVAFVNLNSGKECAVVFETDSTIEDQFLHLDGKGDKYHTTVTVFEPDVIRDGFPFDYVEYLLEKPQNRELEIIKESPNAETAHGETYATASTSRLLNPKIPQPEPFVKSKNSTKGGGLDALRKQYGEIKPGEKPVRESHVPRKTEKHKNVSQTVRTIIEAGVTPYRTKALQNVQCFHRWAGNHGILKSSNKNIPK